MPPQIPVILIDQSIAQAFLIFNPNDWNGESKLIVQSCAGINRGSGLNIELL